MYLCQKETGIFPKPIKNIFGNYIDETEIKQKKITFRLHSYLEDDLFFDTKHGSVLYESLGSFMTKMNLHLLSFRNETFENNTSIWDISNTSHSRKYLAFIQKEPAREITEYFIDQFEKNALPVLRGLRKSIIHNDANDKNILTNKGKVSGIFDFGDIVYSALINELAVAIAYTVIEKENPLYWSSIILSAYNKILALKTEEIEILYFLIPLRLCISICNSSYNQTFQPENKYISIMQKPALNTLNIWKNTDPEYAKELFREAISSTIC